MGQANLGSDFCEKHDVALGDVMDVLKTLVSSGKITQEDSDLFLAVISGKTRKDLAATIDLSAGAVSSRVNRVGRHVGYVIGRRAREQKYASVTDIEDFSKVANIDLTLMQEAYEHPERFQIEQDAAWSVFMLYLSGYSSNNISQQMPEVHDIRRAFNSKAEAVVFAVGEASHIIELWNTGSDVRTMDAAPNDFAVTDEDFQKCLKDLRVANATQCDLLVAYYSGTKAREVVRRLNLCYGVLISELNAVSSRMRTLLNDQKLKKATTPSRAGHSLSAMNLG